MKNYKLFLFLFFILSSFIWNGCVRNKQRGLIFYNDFESIKGWSPSANLVNTIKAHSGMYTSKLDSINKFGLTFKLQFGQITDHPIKKVKFKIWVFFKSTDAQGKFVVEVTDPDNKNLFWQGSHMYDKKVTAGEWGLISGEYTLPDSIMKPKNIISLYPWNITQKDIYVDDMEIEFVI